MPSVQYPPLSPRSIPPVQYPRSIPYWTEGCRISTVDWGFWLTATLWFFIYWHCLPCFDPESVSKDTMSFQDVRYLHRSICANSNMYIYTYIYIYRYLKYIHTYVGLDLSLSPRWVSLGMLDPLIEVSPAILHVYCSMSSCFSSPIEASIFSLRIPRLELYYLSKLQVVLCHHLPSGKLT